MMIMGKDMVKINEKNERIHEINEGIQNVSFHYDCNKGFKLVTLNSFAPDLGGAKGGSQMNGFQQNPRKNLNLGNFEILKKIDSIQNSIPTSNSNP